MTSVVGSAFYEHVAPALGVLCANGMFFAPLLELLELRRRGTLGEVNPLQFPGIVLNSIGWLVYGCELPDAYLFFANFFGALLGVWYTLQCLRVMDAQSGARIEAMLLCAGGIWALAGIVRVTAFAGRTEGRLIFEVGTVTALVLFYAFPLSTMVEVIRTRDSSSIIAPLSALSWLNGACWTVYGVLAIKNPWVWAPNGIGVVLASVQLLLSLIYPKTKRAANRAALRERLAGLSQVAK